MIQTYTQIRKKVFVTIFGGAMALSACTNGTSVNSSSTPQFVYVSGDGLVSMYSVNQSSGVLVPLTPSSISAPGATYGNPDTAGPNIAVNLAGTYAYILNGNSSGGVNMFGILGDGTLLPLSPESVAAQSAPMAIALTPDGSYAYVANTESSVSMYSITNGILTALSPESTIAQPFPSTIVLTPSGKYAYVPDGDNSVYMYMVAPNGLLEPLSPESVATGSGINGITVNPAGTYAYVATFGDTLAIYSITESGLLNYESAIATGQAPSAVTFNPTGTYAYIANQFDGTVSMFSVVESNGTLLSLTPESVATGIYPSAILINPAGTYAYVSNSGESTVSMYSINESGVLNPLSPESTVATQGGSYAITFN